MTKFAVRESKSATIIWTYIIEAESEEEAMSKFFEKENIIPDTMDIELDDEEYHDTQYSVEEYEYDDEENNNEEKTEQ